MSSWAKGKRMGAEGWQERRRVGAARSVFEEEERGAI
jgi:hypothetical protein